ncbi:serine dehydratase subunit alpha family protein, partial [bacterium]|nr:serine dehydratase subunit alpha family protein [candidate division CSSED10-310 bacterium]
MLKSEVFPALGCTEPIAVAYAASLAAFHAKGDILSVEIIVDPGVFKNGMAVTVPNTGGKRGNLIAGAIGAVLRDPDKRMEILKNVTAEVIDAAESLISSGKASIRCRSSLTQLFIDVRVKTASDTVRALIEHSHTNVTLLERNGKTLLDNTRQEMSNNTSNYKYLLKEKTICELVEYADAIDSDDYAYIKSGIEMNLRVSEAGKELRRVGYYLLDLMKKGYLLNDVFSTTKIITASATDARMAGLNYPVMSSGGSGNQGVVAILVPYNVGIWFGIPEDRIIRSIALSHLLNSYVKCYTGDLSVICGCAIAAGVGAAAAIVYQQFGRNMDKIALAVNNLISDLGGMLCDGAKEGCALKVASSADSAIRAAYMAFNDHGITNLEGFIGNTPEET